MFAVFHFFVFFMYRKRSYPTESRKSSLRVWHGFCNAVHYDFSHENRKVFVAISGIALLSSSCLAVFCWPVDSTCVSAEKFLIPGRSLVSDLVDAGQGPPERHHQTHT